MSIAVETRIERHNNWRMLEPAAKPLLGLAWEPDVYPLPEMLQRFDLGKEVTPEQIQPEIFLEWIESCYQSDTRLQSDLIQGFAPAFGIPWIEAIAGCPVTAQPGSLWAEQCLGDYGSRPPIVFDPDNPWLKKLIDCTRVFVEFSAGRFPVTLPLTRGPLDTLAAMRGPQRMALDCYDQREQVITILNELTDLWIAVCEAVLEWIPPFHGGYCSRMKMWAPGPAVTPQNDVSSLISAKMYREIALQFDDRIVHSFPYHSYHLHDTEHHQVDNLLTLDKLTCIQMFLQHGSGGPPLETVLPVIRRTLSSKPVILGAENIETVERCLDELPAAGLCLLLSTDAVSQIPEGHQRWLERRNITRD